MTRRTPKAAEGLIASSAAAFRLSGRTADKRYRSPPESAGRQRRTLPLGARPAADNGYPPDGLTSARRPKGIYNS